MVSASTLTYLVLVFGGAAAWAQTLLLDEEFDTLNLTRWQHEITLGGGGNWEFEYYTNNRSNSYVRGGVLYMQPTFLADDIGIPANRPTLGGTVPLSKVVSHCPSKRALIPPKREVSEVAHGQVEFFESDSRKLAMHWMHSLIKNVANTVTKFHH